jgi:hypothetical protein
MVGMTFEVGPQAGLGRRHLRQGGLVQHHGGQHEVCARPLAGRPLAGLVDEGVESSHHSQLGIRGANEPVSAHVRAARPHVA